ncbi:MAG: Ig-like domain-containing protein [Oscillospiraceae bacterium]|nr:Ig-like domain-containing protein [Oscillospiraceae bacterium]
MKKIFALFLAFVFAFGVVPFSALGADEWAGWVGISTPEDLRLLNNSSNKFYLRGDIELNDITSWQPIPLFKGTLDGNNFAIMNLTSTRGGLFNRLDGATIKNLGLLNVDVRFASTVGGLSNEYSQTITVENSYITGRVAYIGNNPTLHFGASGFVGARIGDSGEARFINCYNGAAVTSSISASGISTSLGVYTNCINAGEIIGGCKDGYIGGITSNLVGKTMSFCYNFAKIANTVNNLTGGLAGETESAYIRGGATIGKAVATTDRISISETIENAELSEFKKSQTYEGFDFENIWYINPQINDGFPLLRSMSRHYQLTEEEEEKEEVKEEAATVIAIALHVRLRVGDRIRLGAALNPADSDERITYSSNRPAVASVSSAGVVRARTPGAAIITVAAGNVSQRIRIRVS